MFTEKLLSMNKRRVVEKKKPYLVKIHIVHDKFQTLQ